MLMLAGVGTTAVLLLVKLTVIGPGAAFASSVTVPVTVFPPLIVLAPNVNAFTSMGRTLSVTLLLTPPALAVTVPLVRDATALVGMEKVTELAPAGTVTLAGTLAAELVLVRVTTTGM